MQTTLHDLGRVNRTANTTIRDMNHFTINIEIHTQQNTTEQTIDPVADAAMSASHPLPTPSEQHRMKKVDLVMIIDRKRECCCESVQGVRVSSYRSIKDHGSTSFKYLPNNTENE